MDIDNIIRNKLNWNCWKYLINLKKIERELVYVQAEEVHVPDQHSVPEVQGSPWYLSQ